MSRDASSTAEPAPGTMFHARECECPCHRGAVIFHVVECCGSVLGRRRVRESLVGDETSQPQRSGSARELRSGEPR
jgi:hypothetical protein